MADNRRRGWGGPESIYNYRRGEEMSSSENATNQTPVNNRDNEDNRNGEPFQPPRPQPTLPNLNLSHSNYASQIPGAENL